MDRLNVTYQYNAVLFVQKKKNKVLMTYATVWINLENMMAGERRKSPKIT